MFKLKDIICASIYAIIFPFAFIPIFYVLEMQLTGRWEDYVVIVGAFLCSWGSFFAFLLPMSCKRPKNESKEKCYIK